MNDAMRARAVAAAAAHISGNKISNVYDYSKGQHQSISAEVSNDSLSGYDYRSSTHFSGGSTADQNFYDHHASSHVQLKIEGDKFSGYDYKSSNHFSGSIKGKNVSF